MAVTQSLRTEGDALRRSAKPARDNPPWSERIGTLILAIIMLMPVMGVFFPPDIWLKYPGDDIAARQAMTVLPITQLMVRLTSATLMFWLVKNWRANLTEAKYSFLILLQLLAFASSIFWSDDFVQTYKQSFSLLTVYALMLHILHKYTLREFVSFMTRLSSISAGASFFVIIFLPGMSHNLGASNYLSAIRGAFVQKNFLGEICSIAILTAAYSWYTRANSRMFAGCVFGANALLLIGSDSVTSILTTAVGMGLYAIAYLSRSFLGRLLLFCLTLCIGLVAIAVVTNVDSLAELVGRTSGLTGRTALWQVLENMIAQRPTHGYGLGFWLFQDQDLNNVWLSVGWAAPEAHDDVLDVLLQTGYVGLAFYLINNIASLILGFRRFGNLEDGSIFCLVIIVVFFYRSYTETATVIVSGKGIVILYLAQAYLYKLSFSPRSVRQRLNSPQIMPATLSAVP